MFDSPRSRPKRRAGKLRSSFQRAKKRRRLSVEPLEDRRPLAVMQLADLLDGGAADADGFGLTSVAPQDLTGYSVSMAGDINRDGYDDLLIGAPVDATVPAGTGTAYVVYGKPSGFTDVSLSGVFGGPDGATLFGLAAEDHAGFSVSMAGDVNADGYHDFLIGAPYSDTATFFGTGQAYLVFGTADTLPTSVGLLDGANGFLMQGLLGFDRAGFSVDTAGDINGDGFDDLVIGAPSDDSQNTTGVGQAYVVYGKADGFDATVNLWQLVGDSGFPLFGLANDDHLGSAVGTVGDVNGDGFDDFAVSAPYADPLSTGNGSTYIIFGGDSPALGVNALDGSNGFRVDGFIPFERAGFSVSSAGDFNGDGFDDILIGAPGDRDDPWEPFDYANPAGAGRAYVIYGKADDFDAVINLGDVDTTGDGFSITGIDGLAIPNGDGVDYAGFSVSSAGDVDGDGFDDLIIGAPYVDTDTTVGTGEAYLIFGRADGFENGLTLSLLMDDEGMQLVGDRLLDRVGVSVSGAGDVNGDGFDDVIIGAPSFFPDSGNAGRSFVLFGRDFRDNGVTVGDDTENDLTGDGTANSLIGGQANDSLAGGGGADVLRGGQGDDTAFVSDLLFRRVDGGRGFDTLTVVGPDLALDLAAVPDNRIRGIEQIDLAGTGSNSLSIGTLQEVLNLSDTSNQLMVLRDIDDPVDIGTGWTEVSPQVIDGKTFRVYEQGAATVLVQEAAPELDLNGSDDTGIDFAATHVEDGGPVTIVDADLTIIDDSGPTSATVTITNLLDGDSEALAVAVGSTGIQSSYDSTTGVLTLSGAATAGQYQEVLRTLTYENTSQSPDTTDRLVEVTVDDGIFTSSAATATVSLTAVNDAPFMVSTPLFITVIDEDTTDPPGRTIEDIIPDSKIRDADGTALQSVAVIHVDNTNGVWQYKTGTDWMDFGNPTESDARLLNGAAEFRFVPNPDFAGVTTMKMRAWDETSGSVGDVADVLTNGGTSAFSTALATASVSVNAINDAPLLDTVASPTLSAIFEDETNSAGTLVSALVPDGSIIDADGTAVEAIAVIDVDTTNGNWQHSADGQSWQELTASTTAAVLMPPTHWVRFVPNANYHGMASFEFRAWDRTSGSDGGQADTTTTGGTTAFSDASDLAEITVQPVDDLPTLDPISNLDFIGGIASHTLTLNGITDGDEGNEVLTVTATTNNSNLLETPTIAYTSPDPTGSATLTFVPDQFGQAAVTVIVTEQDGHATSQSFVVTVGDPTKQWQNPGNSLDVDNNGFVVPLDALLVINALNKRDLIDDTNRLQTPPPAGSPPPYLDPSGDGFLTALDVLQIINFLNSQGSPEGEGESNSQQIAAAQATESSPAPPSEQPSETDTRPALTAREQISAVPQRRSSHHADRHRFFAEYAAADDELLFDALSLDFDE